MVAIPDLSRLSGAEKDALILALLERLDVAERRIAELEAKAHRTAKDTGQFQRAAVARSEVQHAEPGEAA